MNPWPGKGAVTLDEYGRYVGCSPKVLRGMIERGELRAFRLGREWRIPRSEAFRILGEEDPEGPVGPTPLARKRLAARDEAIVQRILGR